MEARDDLIHMILLSEQDRSTIVARVKPFALYRQQNDGEWW
jgi:hypothetical protein